MSKTDGLTIDDLKKLREPFDESTICVKVQQLSKKKDKAGLVLYLQHTDVYARIEEVDPLWSCEITGEQYFAPQTEGSQEWFNLRAKVTIKGVSRENTGEGRDKKSATSDAIKRAAMLFGVGRYLYDTETVWVPYNEQTDYYKTFTISEYMAAIRPGQVRPPIKGSAPSSPPAATQPPSSQEPSRGARSTVTRSTPAKPMIATVDGKTRDQLAVEIVAASKELGMKGKELEEYILDEMKKPTTKLLIQEMQTVLEKLHNEIFMMNAKNQD